MKKTPTRKKRKKIALEIKEFYRLKTPPNARHDNIEKLCTEINSFAFFGLIK